MIICNPNLWFYQNKKFSKLMSATTQFVLAQQKIFRAMSSAKRERGGIQNKYLEIASILPGFTGFNLLTKIDTK